MSSVHPLIPVLHTFISCAPAYVRVTGVSVEEEEDGQGGIGQLRALYNVEHVALTLLDTRHSKGTSHTDG